MTVLVIVNEPAVLLNVPPFELTLPPTVLQLQNTLSTMSTSVSPCGTRRGHQRGAAVCAAHRAKLRARAGLGRTGHTAVRKPPCRDEVQPSAVTFVSEMYPEEA